MAFRQMTVTTIVQQVIAFNPNRTAVSLKSLGAARVYISYDQVDVAGQGFALDSGEGISLIAVDGDDSHMALYCVTAALTADLRIEESFAS